MSDAVLTSWSQTETRSKIEDFVAAVATGPNAVPKEERIAVFDNDGTLWTEKPMQTQLLYIFQQWAAAAKADPSLADRQPYKAVVTGDYGWLGGAIDKHYTGDDSDLKIMIAALVATQSGVSVEDYQADVAAFYENTQQPALQTSFKQSIYQPMVELLRYLEANDFSCYIVSGGDRDFMRPMTEDYYGIPPERVVGSSVAALTYDEDSNEIRYGATFDYFDDGPQKPIRIWSRTGRRPILACGNSNGDVAMLRYVQKHERSLSLLVHHDDDSGRGDEPYDKGAEDALAAAAEHDFTVISVKNDWTTVFPADQ
jgi:phosphoserine phosphatase